MKGIVLSLCLVAALASIASAATTCKGYDVSTQAQDFAWVKLKLEPILKKFVAEYPGSSYTLKPNGAKNADIKVIASGASAADIKELTAALAAAVDKEPTLRTIVDKPSLCPDVAATFYCKKLSIVAKAGDAAWIKLELAKAKAGFEAYYKPCKATITLSPISTTSGLPTATANVQTTCPNAFTKYFSEYKWKYMESVTVSDCGAVKPTIPPVKPAVPSPPVVKPTFQGCRGYIITAKAGDFAWVKNAIEKALGPLKSKGVYYKLTSTGPTTSKLSIRAPASVWPDVWAALKPDNYIISFTPTTPDSSFCVAPVTALCVKLDITGKAGDYDWVKMEVTKALKGLKAVCPSATYTIEKVGTSNAKVVVRYPSSCTGVPAYLKDNVKPSSYILKVVAGNC